jgi:N-acetyl sugar amidotransferase
MRYCIKCVQPDTRPGIQFTPEGVCPACLYLGATESIDWSARRAELDLLADFGRKSNVSGYDCIVGVSGGKDSTRQALYIRDELKMNPLLVSLTYPPQQQTKIGAYNLSNLIALGFNCISVSPNPQVWKLLMREGFLRYGNWCKSTETALCSSVPIISIAYHIPLMFLGENPALTLGGDVGSQTADANQMKHFHHTIKDGPDVLLVEETKEKDLFWYRYPTDDEMSWTGMKIVFLGYFIKDFTRFKNAEISIANGLKIRSDPPEDIGDNYGFEALDDDFVVINQMFKHLKFGFGKVTDQSSEAVRLGMMSRDDAVKAVLDYDGKCAPHFIDRFCNYLGITHKQFWETAERFRNPDIWHRDSGSGKWLLKEKIKRGVHEIC